MKQLILSALVLASLSTKAQVHTLHNKVVVNRDTLHIPVGQYKFIEMGGKVYKVVTTLEEVEPITSGTILWNNSGFGTLQTTTTPGTIDLDYSNGEPAGSLKMGIPSVSIDTSNFTTPIKHKK